MQAWFIGAPDIMGDEFVRGVGPEEAKVLSFVREPPDVDDSAAQTFNRKYAERNVEARTQRRPDARAYRSLLATDHLATALANAGADRGRVRRELQSMERTVSGEQHCDELIARRAIKLARLIDGRWETLEPAARPDRP